MTLTREEIQSMDPGRILDAKVAELVMGLDMVEGQLPQLPRYYLTDYEKTIHRDVPLYSSDISAAWEVDEKIRGLGLDEVWGNKISRIIFMDNERPSGTYDIAHASAEQRCKAALLAVLNL